MSRGGKETSIPCACPTSPWVCQQCLGPSSPKTYSTDWDGPTPSSTLHQSNYSRDPGTVTTLLEQLELPPLSTRRKIARITLLHKAIHEKVAISIPSYIIKPTRTSRFHHPKRYIQIRPKKDVYKYSFFPRTIRDWNQLSDELLDIESIEEFKSRLTKLYYGDWTTWTKDDDFILILITCKYAHFWDFTVYTKCLSCWRTSQILEWWVNDLFQVNTIDR